MEQFLLVLAQSLPFHSGYAMSPPFSFPNANLLSHQVTFIPTYLLETLSFELSHLLPATL